MSARWVAGSVRARALPTRRLGAVGARALAAGSPTEAVAVLAHSPYGREVRADDSLAVAQHGVAQTLLWHLRVLAGWLPPEGVQALRLLAGWFEVANVDEHVRLLVSPAQVIDPPFRLGALATAWPRLAGTASAAELRTALAGSPWGDPGGQSPREIALSMRAGWADRVAAGLAAVEPVPQWAAAGLALLAAREAAGGAPPRAQPAPARLPPRAESAPARLPPRAQAAAVRLLGAGWAEAVAAGTAGLGELAAALPRSVRWVLRGSDDPAELWRAEARWWARLRTDGTALLGGSGFGLAPVVGAVALLAVDAWQVRAALEVAARAGAGTEVLDAVA